jgi:hypothetical protein
MHADALRDIHPPLRASLRYGLLLGVGLLVLALVTGPLLGAITGRAPWPAVRYAQMAALCLTLGVLLGYFVFAANGLWAWTVEDDGVSGRRFWGRREHLRWDEIGQVSPRSIHGIPCLTIATLNLEREVHACNFGVDLSYLLACVVERAGPDHPLALALARHLQPPLDQK